MIPPQTIEKIFSAAKIEEVVQDYVPLKRRGANLIGLCPFHSERTGSFTVSPSKGIFKCFGCGESGNAVGFVMKIDNCSYADALRSLAKKYHIEIEERELTPEEQQHQDNREAMFAVNEWANKWFQDQLWNTAEGQAIGLKYFRERGLQDATIKDFQLGYSPDKHKAFTDAAHQAGYIDKYLTNDPDTGIGTGVCGKNDKGEVYDRFRDRVMFPIFTSSGKTVAFAGRILRKKYDKNGNEIPTGKYVNSPGSTIYSKTNELYGLYQAKQQIARQNLCYLVEGQMDVLSMHQVGICNVVASGGTALTKEQVRLIKRFTTNITVLYDGDAAGIHAAIRGIDMFLTEGFFVKVVLLPDGEDPDSYARTHDASEFMEYIRAHQQDFIRFKAQFSWEQAKNDPSQRSELTHDLVRSIAVIPDEITRHEYIRDCAQLLQTAPELLTRAVDQQRMEASNKATEEYRAQRRMQEQNGILSSRSSSTPATDSAAPAEPTETVASRPRMTKTEQNLRNLTELLVRYGDKALYSFPNGTNITVGGYILQQIETDGVDITLPTDKRIFEEFKAHQNDEGFVAEKFFTFHPDQQINAMACDLIADRYQLSSIFSKVAISENVVLDVEQRSEHDLLVELVPQLLCELRLSLVNDRIDAVQQQMKADPDGEQSLQLLGQLNSLNAVKREICKYLGNRMR